MNEYMTLGEAAEYLQVSRTTLRQRIAEGKLKPIPSKLDTRTKLIPREQLDKLKEYPTLTSEDIAAANKAFESAKNEPEYDIDEVFADFELVKAG